MDVYCSDGSTRTYCTMLVVENEPLLSRMTGRKNTKKSESGEEEKGRKGQERKGMRWRE